MGSDPHEADAVLCRARKHCGQDVIDRVARLDLTRKEEVLVWSKFFRTPEKEIACLLGWRPGTVGSRSRHASVLRGFTGIRGLLVFVATGDDERGVEGQP